jgi:proteasome beta subunit
MREDLGAGGGTGLELEHGTTIVAATFAGGVVIAGDRRATQASMISKRDVRKVFRTDDYSAAGVAGVWSLAVEMVRLFQVELEHYENMPVRDAVLACVQALYDAADDDSATGWP